MSGHEDRCHYQLGRGWGSATLELPFAASSRRITSNVIAPTTFIQAAGRAGFPSNFVAHLERPEHYRSDPERAAGDSRPRSPIGRRVISSLYLGSSPSFRH